MIFNFTPPSVNIDPTLFQEIGKQVAPALQTAKTAPLIAQLTQLKITYMNSELDDAGRTKATELAEKMAEAGCLYPEHRSWFVRHGIHCSAEALKE